MLRSLLLLCVIVCLSAPAFAQCQRMVLNPVTHKLDCNDGGGNLPAGFTLSTSCTGPSADWVTQPSGNNFACFDFNNSLTSNGGFPSAGWQATINQFGGSQNAGTMRVSVLAPSTEVGNIEALQVFAGSQLVGGGVLTLYVAGEAFATSQNLYGANITVRDCNRKNCNDPTATSFATLLVGGMEIDSGISNPNTQQSRILVLEHGPDSKSQAGTGAAPRDYGLIIANDADVLIPTVVCTGTCTGGQKMTESSGAGFSGDTYFVYCAKFDANGTPDTWEWTNYCSTNNNTGSDLVIGAANSVTSATLNPAINGGAQYGFTNGTLGDQVEITAGTNCTVGKYTVKSVLSAVGTLGPSPGTQGSTCTYTLWQAQNTTVSANTLTITNAGGTTATGGAHTFLSATDADQTIHITAQVTGSCTVGYYHIISVAAGTATVDSQMGTNTSTCTYDIMSVHYNASVTTTHLILPADSTTTIYRQGQAIRPVATSYGVKIQQDATTGNTVGDTFRFQTTGVPNINIGIAGVAGSMDKWAVISPSQLGPSSIGLPLVWQALDATAALLQGQFQFDFQNSGQFLFSTPGQIRIQNSAGVDKAFYDVATPAWNNNNYCNFTACNNSKLALNTTGSAFTRNIADASPALTVQQVNASSTGDVVRFANNAGNLLVIDQTGKSAFVRNVADANPAMTVQQANASATGDILRLANNAGNFFVVAQTGLITGFEPTVATINQTGKTASISTATLCGTGVTACGGAGQYHVHWDFWGSGSVCTNVTAGSVTFLLTWTDENAVVHSAVALQMMGQTGAATEAMGSTFPFQLTSLANESASGDFTFSSNGSIVQYATGYTACTTGTGTYNLRAAVTRLQ